MDSKQRRFTAIETEVRETIEFPSSAKSGYAINFRSHDRRTREHYSGRANRRGVPG